MLERRTYDRPRVGETLDAEVGPLLRELGAWEALEELLGEQVPFRGVLSAWGSSELVERPSMLHPLGEGWHVDRARFDDRLAQWAASHGVSVRTRSGRCRIERQNEGFVVAPARGDAIVARRILDASGRGAPATSSAPIGRRRWLAWDRQVAIVGRMKASGARLAPELLLEAAEIGWWYSVPQPDGTLVVTLVTDADLGPVGGRSTLDSRFHALLEQTRHTLARARGLVLQGALEVVRADSGRLLPDRGDGWLAIGDAAMATDPLAGNGVARALRAALAAVTSWQGPADPEPALTETWSAFLASRARYYATETRWPDATFWARRTPIDWENEPLVLGPEITLAWSREPPPSVEALLPPQVIRTVRTTLARPRPAHVVLTRMCEVAPVASRLLLVGLQLLVDSGAVKAS